MRDLQPPKNDGLPIPEVGDWSRNKHYLLWRYIFAFTTSMKEKEWSGLHYIDLFAGPGVVRTRASRELLWGSPLLAAQAPFSFARLHCCELDPKNYEALCRRLGEYQQPSPAQLLTGDANEKVSEIAAEIPPGSLSLAFLDPYGLHLQFETLEALSRKRADLIIFFPDHLDALRNCKYVYKDKPDSNLDRVLGPGADWRTRLDQTPPDRWAEALRELYEKQIRTLGYNYFEYERVSSGGHPLYRLIFCSKHQLGAKIWRRISAQEPDGQRRLDF